MNPTLEPHNPSEPEENFEELLKESLSKGDSFSPGDRVFGRIVFLDEENAFVDISGKREAMIAVEELRDDQGAVTVKPGDTLEAWVVSAGRDLILTACVGKGKVTQQILEMAFQNSIPIFGKILEIVKGGYSVSLSGMRAFCPFSQFDVKSREKPENNIARGFLFLITQLESRNIVLSRKNLLERDRSARKEELKKSLKIGDTVKGTIAGIRDFGVFVDLGGFEGLVPRTELSRSRNVDLKGYAQGQEISAVVKSIDWDTDKISLSAKETMPEPWSSIAKFNPGDTVEGIAVNIIKNGVFVEIEPGLDGFLPVSRMSSTKKIDHPEQVLHQGDRIMVRILEIRPQEKRMSLELVTGESDPWFAVDSDFETAVHSGMVEASKAAGVNLRLSNGMLGFVPREELLSSRPDVQKEYPAGKEMRAAVLEIDPLRKKLILSEKESAKMEERADLEKFTQEPSGEKSSSLGSLFREKFQDIQKKMEKG